MKVTNKLGLIVFGSLLAANIVAPQVLSAHDCCKYCGWGGYGSETTRWAESCPIYCCVSLCDNKEFESTNCQEGSYLCDGAFIDNCSSYVPCC